jgi:hypothetical protein
MLGLRERLGDYARALTPVRQARVRRPVVIFQSDDWGLCGIPDAAGVEALRAAGLPLGESPWDGYSLETAEDVRALAEVLAGHRDASGRTPVFVCNFIVANVDFAQVAAGGHRTLGFRPLADGLPAPWRRPDLVDAYRQAVRRGLVYPALHGSSHFCRQSVERVLSAGGPPAERLRALYAVGSPLVSSQMPWAGFEYRDADAGWLPQAQQADLVAEAAQLFRRLFGSSPVSACAPGYRANRDTFVAWRRAGIAVAQQGPQELAPYFDAGLLHLSRTCEFEPALRERPDPVGEVVAAARRAADRGLPVVISTHSINYQSALRDHRGPTLALLDQLLAGLERELPDLLYLHDADLLAAVRRGRLERGGASIQLPIEHNLAASPTLRARLFGDPR